MSTTTTEPATAIGPWQSLQTRLTLSMLALFLAGLWSLSYYANLILREDMEALAGDQQFSTVSVVADSVNDDVKDRLRALDAVAAGVSPALLRDGDALRGYLDRLPLLKNYFNAGVLAFNLDGMAMAGTQALADRAGTSHGDHDAVTSALQHGKQAVGYPILDKALQAPVFSMAVPVRDEQGHIIGALSGATNLSQPNFLDQVTQYRYGRTGGYMLVAPRQRLVVTATDKARTLEALPGPGVSPLMDRFLNGFEGAGVSTNPKGVEVLASAKGIPTANWYLAAALPTSEAFGPIHNMQRRMWIATLVLTVLAGALTWWMIRRQLAPLASTAHNLAAMSTSQNPPEPLPITRNDEIGQVLGGFNRLLATLAQREDALKRNERKFLDILENVDAYIYLKAPDRRYLFANRTMRRLCGVSMEGIVGKTDADFFDARTVEQLRANDHRVLTDGVTLRTDESVHNLATNTTTTHLSVKLPLRNAAGDIYALCGISANISDRKQAEEELRIAAIAFECQEGLLVLDPELRILRVNRAFTRITGYERQDVEGKVSIFGKSGLQPTQVYANTWDHLRSHGIWHGDMWLKRKDGADYLCRTTMTAVRDNQGTITHFVGNFTDATDSYLQEQKRVLNETAHRNALVREVHHRIKNNLQGITGLLRQFAAVHPETREPVDHAISQVRSVAVLHGLQGRKSMDTVRLCELTSAIASDVQSVWQTPVHVDIPPHWTAGIVAESEAVPMALVINELLVNAVKHGGKADGQVQVTLRKGVRPEHIQIAIHNAGRLSRGADYIPDNHVGLHLVDSLMPRHGVTLTREQDQNTVVTRLLVEPPVITLEQVEMYEPE